MAWTARTIVEAITQALVEKPEYVEVKEIAGARTDILEVSVAPGDLGKVIGKEGRTAEAIRHLAHAVGHKHGRSVHVAFLDPASSRDGRSARR